MTARGVTSVWKSTSALRKIVVAPTMDGAYQMFNIERVRHKPNGPSMSKFEYFILVLETAGIKLAIKTLFGKQR